MCDEKYLNPLTSMLGFGFATGEIYNWFALIVICMSFITVTNGDSFYT